MSKSKKNANISFELILIMALAVVIAAILFVSHKYCDNKNSTVFVKQTIADKYNNILSTIRSDTKKAESVSIDGNAFSLLEKDLKVFARYEFKNNTFSRIDSVGNVFALLDDVKLASFSTESDLPNLLTIRILPNDEKAIPFFTSFALRGFDND